MARDFVRDEPWQSVKDQPAECSRLNLIYHVCPFSDSTTWQKNVWQITRRWKLFTGRKIIAIATGEHMAPVSDVRAAFGDLDAEFIEVPNSSIMRERVSFPKLMTMIESTDEAEATFYAHAKGVTRENDPGVEFWRNGMYHVLLDQNVIPLLNRYSFVGTHQVRRDTSFADGVSSSPWHFSGTFWWFRHKDVFTKDWRNCIPDGGWAVEAFPGVVCPNPEDAACVWMKNPGHSYDPSIYRLRVDDGSHLGSSSDVRLEIGGGRSPRQPGFINVDQLDDDLVDIQFNFDDLLTGSRLPYGDGDVRAVYSSHCFEHLRSDTMKAVLWEICRVLPIGGTFELVMPHWNHNAAMIDGHLRTIGEDQVKHWTETAIDYWWKGSPKRLSLNRTRYVPSENLTEAKGLFPGFSEQQIMRYIPNTCHEVAFNFTVVANS